MLVLFPLARNIPVDGDRCHASVSRVVTPADAQQAAAPGHHCLRDRGIHSAGAASECHQHGGAARPKRWRCGRTSVGDQPVAAEDLARRAGASRYNEELVAIEQQRQEQKKQEESLRLRRATRVAAVVNAVLPIGWLPYGARAAAQGSLWPGLLGSLGALALGCLCLRRSYRTTLRFYTGGFQTGERKQTAVVDQGAAARREISWNAGSAGCRSRQQRWRWADFAA